MHSFKSIYFLLCLIAIFSFSKSFKAKTPTNHKKHVLLTFSKDFSIPNYMIPDDDFPTNNDVSGKGKSMELHRKMEQESDEFDESDGFDEPDDPGESDEPDEPDESDDPSEPNEPDEPEDTDDSDDPDESEDSDDADKPDDPEDTDEPDEPDETEDSDDADKPDEPEDPDEPDEPNKSDKPGGPIDCSVNGKFIPHESDCNKFYVCNWGKAHLYHCGPGTVWDPSFNGCNWPQAAGRTDCK